MIKVLGIVTGNRGGFHVPENGSRFLFIKGPEGTEETQDFEAQATQLVVVDNWFEELKLLASPDPQ